MKLKDIIEEVSKECKFNFLKKTRQRKFVYARFIYFYLAKKHTDQTYQQIGDTFGITHASVLHGVNSAKSFFKTDKEFRERIINIEIELKKRFNIEFSDEDGMNQLKTKYKKELLNMHLNYLEKISSIKNIKVKKLTANPIINELLNLSDKDFNDLVQYKIKPHLKMLESKVTNQDLINKQFETRKN